MTEVLYEGLFVRYNDRKQVNMCIGGRVEYEISRLRSSSTGGSAFGGK